MVPTLLEHPPGLSAVALDVSDRLSNNWYSIWLEQLRPNETLAISKVPSTPNKAFRDHLRTLLSHPKSSSYSLALNPFASLNFEEFQVEVALSTFLDHATTTNRSSLRFRESDDHKPLPTSVDWEKKGVVTPVQSEVIHRCCAPTSHIRHVKAIACVFWRCLLCMLATLSHGFKW